MALQTQNILLSFSQGVNSLADPYQLQFGKFETLKNSVFVQTQGVGRLNKRNGFPQIATLSDGSSFAITTFNGGLIAIGRSVKTYADGPSVWSAGSDYIPLQMSVQKLANSNYSQLNVDTAVSNNSLVCATYAQVTPATFEVPGQPSGYGYTIFDRDSGNTIIPYTSFTSTTGAFASPNAPKVFSLGKYFVIVLGATTGPTTGVFQYFTIDQTAPTTVSVVGSISSSYYPLNTSSNSSFDGIVASNTLFLSWNGNAQTGIFATTISSAGAVGSVVTISSMGASLVSVSADTTQSPPTIWTATWTIGTDTGRVVQTNFDLTTRFSSHPYASSPLSHITGTAQNGVFTLYRDIPGSYSYGTSGSNNEVKTYNFLDSVGSALANSVITSGLGIASKAFIVNSSSYFLGAFQSQYQSTYFLVASSGAVAAKLAYGNGPGYISGTLPNANVSGSSVSIGYIYKNSLTTAQKLTDASSTTSIAGVFSTTGTALVNFTFDPGTVSVVEDGSNLNLSGGYLWSFDGIQATENNFHVYPEPVTVVTNSSGGSLIGGNYFYQVLYEWKDYKGNIFRSAPSIPVQNSVGSGTFYSSFVYAPTLRITQKPDNVFNPVLIKFYRWSNYLQNYYLVSQAVNSKTSNSVFIQDKSGPLDIIGNELLYTTGGVVENTGAPATNAITLWDSRLWLIDAETEDLWFSKQVLPGVPVEMSELLTYTISPASIEVGFIGKPKCIAPMDDKLILFFKNAIFFINGIGPDNTGASNQYTPSPIFITGGVGCTNQASIVLTPNGLMFQSDKGIWLVGRDLSVKDVGQDVYKFNTSTVKSALLIPGTNEVRFTLASSSQTLMYDYLASQWDQFDGIPGVSATLFEGKHTYLNQGAVYQETPGTYIDGSTATVMSFTTGWINLGGVEEYVRAYSMYLLGKFSSPHILTLGIAYNYNPAIMQTVVLNPTNVLGSGSSVEQWEINFSQQQCQSFQVTFTETASGTAGAGVYLSGFNIVAGLKKDSPRNIPSTNRTG